MWGIYDMHGNVWEWCNDWYGEKFLVADTEDPIGPAAANDNCKVLRGGSFTSSPLDLRCGTRYSYDYKRGKKNVGFRIVCAPEL
jgi:formylglycine-generating enzyme required for sulfatase activity